MVFVVMEGRGLIVIGGCVNARKDYIHTCRRLYCGAVAVGEEIIIAVIIILCCDAMSGVGIPRD